MNPKHITLGTARNTFHPASDAYSFAASNEYNLTYLKSCGMLLENGDDHGVYHFVWLFGTRGVKYMTLPQPNKTDIAPNASHDMLFVPPDRHYVTEVQLEFNKLLGGAQPQQQQEQEVQALEVGEEEEVVKEFGLRIKAKTKGGMPPWT